MNAKRAVKIAGGVLLAVAGIAVSAVVIGHLTFDRRVRGEVDELLRAAEPGTGPIVTEETVAELPEPIGRYLRFTGVVGTRIPRTVRLRQEGWMRLSPGADPIDLEAEQWYTTSPPGFVWDGLLTRSFVPIARARDRYAEGDGSMYVRAAEVYPIVDQTGPEMDQGSMMRYLQEMIAWFPAALLEDYVSFEPVADSGSRAAAGDTAADAVDGAEDPVDVTFSHAGKSVTGRFYVDAEGRYADFVAERYRAEDDGFELAIWRAPLTEYDQMNGLHLGVAGTGVWELEEGDFDYIEPVVVELEYDVEP